MKKIFVLLFSLMITSSFAAPLQKLRVILDWFPNPNHAPLIIAKQQGFFKQQGLDVELIGPADPSDPPKLVAAGKADIGITYQPQLLEQIDNGLPLIRIGTLIDRPLNCLVVIDNSGIKKLADLKGKNIGSSSGGLSSIMLKVMLANHGLTEKDVALTNVKYGLTQPLLAHRVDAVTGMMRNVEVPELEQRGHKVITFLPEENGIPTYSELVFISHKNATRDKRFPHFLEAVKQAVAYLDEHPEVTWKQFAKAYPEANNTVNKEAWFATIPYFAEDPALFDSKEWRHFAEFMHQHQLIKKILPTSRYAIIV